MKLKETGVIYGLQQLSYAADTLLKYADTLYPTGLLGQPVSLWGDIVGTLAGIAGALGLKAPYDLAAAVVGGYLSTDLWNQLARLVPMRAPVPSALVYIPPATVSVRPPVTTGRYVITY